MRIQREPILPAAEAEEAFKRNTAEIMKNAPKPVDDAADKILKDFFGNICKGFLENICNFNRCQRNHKFPSVNVVAPLFQKCTIKQIDDAYGVVSKHPRFLETYVSMFAEFFVKRTTEYESRLARMIMDCEKTSKGHQMYRNIVEVLVAHGKQQRYEAVQLLIKYHTPSIYAEEAIMNLCVETGADMVRFMDYLSKIFATRSIPNSVFDKILSNCVTYQNPALPNFCLNNMITKNIQQLRQINPDNMAQFLELQTTLIKCSSTGQGKMECLARKVHMMNGNQ